MRAQRRASRKGTALLIALVTLVLTLTAITGVASLATTFKLEREFDRQGVMADDLLIAADDAILDWLQTHSSKVVLPPEAETPEILVLHHFCRPRPRPRPRDGDSRHEVEDEVEMELRITAWDQCGMTPLNLAKAGSPLRLALPEHVILAIDSIDPGEDSPLGLDGFARPNQSESASPFPLPHSDGDADMLIFGSSHSHVTNSRLRSRREDDGIREIAVGAYISTHAESMNVNTAPIAALEQALRQLGRGGIEIVVAARSAGDSISLGSLPMQGDAHESSLRLTTASDAWAFRIDARVGAVQRSWWAIYKPASEAQGRTKSAASSGKAPNSGGAWECVQRMVIRD